MNSHLRIALIVCIAATMLTTGTVVYALVHNDEAWMPSEGGVLASFSSYEEFSAFYRYAEDTGADDYWMYADDSLSNPIESSLGDSSYSATNIQVEGVDEADIVKTDGEYIYIASWSRVTIVDVSEPADMKLVGNITQDDLLGFELDNCSVYIMGLYVSEDVMVAVMVVYEYEADYAYSDVEQSFSLPMLRYRTVASVFDIEDPASPVLEYSYGMSGSHRATRMIGDTVYVLTESYIVTLEDDPCLPSLWEGDVADRFEPGKVFYDGNATTVDAFVNLMAIDVATGEHDYMGVVTGYASTVYMSPEALYFTFQKWSGPFLLLEDSVTSIDDDAVRTTIHKVEVDGLSMTATATGEVEGWLLDQWSMDERDGMLRVATTTSWSEPENNVYVLSEDLSVLGSLEGLAPTERIYSSRFIGDTLYLVTFRQVDPLFVIDLSDPSSPEVLGELKVPGFSSYLHPVGDDRLLGIGRENSSVKLSLFDVSDPASPAEQDTYIVEAYSYTAATSDHKAVLFDVDREMLVIPITVYDYSSYYYSSPECGAWVFEVSTDDGISLRGVISHDDASTYYYDGVRRAMYIGDVLFTVSYTSVKSSSLADLTEMDALSFVEDTTQEW